MPRPHSWGRLLGVNLQEGTIPGAGGVPIYFRKFGNSRRALLIPNAAWLARDLVDLYLAAQFSTDADFRRRVAKLAAMEAS